jgi:MFS family permease
MAKKSSYGWVVIISMAIVTFMIVGMTLNTMSIFMTPILDAHSDWTAAAYGVTATVQSIVGVIAMFMVGKLIGKFGCKMVVTFSVICNVAMLLLCAFAESLSVLYIGYGLFGLAFNLGAQVQAPILVNNWFAKKQGLALGINAAAMGAGGIVGAPIATMLIESLGYQTTYIIFAAVVGVFGLIASLLIVNKPPQGVKRLYEDEASTEALEESGATADVPLRGLTFMEALKTKEFWMILIGGGLCMMPFMCYCVTLGNVMITCGMAAVAAGMVVTVYNFVQTGMGFIGGAAIDKFGPMKVIWFGNICFVLFCLLTRFSNVLGEWSLWGGGAVLMGIKAAFFIAPFQLLVAKVFGRKEYHKILPIVMIPVAVATLPLPIYTGVLDATGSYASTFIISAVLVIVGGVLLNLCKKLYKEKEESA